MKVGYIFIDRSSRDFDAKFGRNNEIWNGNRVIMGSYLVDYKLRSLY